jgi:glycerol-3-phosphate acyltransferase PlsX
MLPSSTSDSVLLDVGANVEVKPQHLEQFAVMGSCFFKAVRGVPAPRVALLSVGEEESKGSDLIRQVHQDLKKGPINFIGNIDGKLVYSGHADVIVTDGFTGNAILKASESLLVNMAAIVRGEVRRSLRAKLGYLLISPVVGRLRKRVDHAEYGAVPLLGVARPVFIGHGSSSPRSIRNAVRGARTFVEARVNEAIQDQLRVLAATAQERPAPQAIAEEALRGPIGGGEREA